MDKKNGNMEKRLRFKQPVMHIINVLYKYDEYKILKKLTIINNDIPANS